ncbi:MAG: hypothetical protein ABIL45_04435 [candidate division WOR-3 bacterium]
MTSTGSFFSENKTSTITEIADEIYKFISDKKYDNTLKETILEIYDDYRTQLSKENRKQLYPILTDTEIEIILLNLTTIEALLNLLQNIIKQLRIPEFRDTTYFQILAQDEKILEKIMYADIDEFQEIKFKVITEAVCNIIDIAIINTYITILNKTKNKRMFSLIYLQMLQHIFYSYLRSKF